MTTTPKSYHSNPLVSAAMLRAGTAAKAAADTVLFCFKPVSAQPSEPVARTEEPIRREERLMQGPFIAALGLEAQLRAFTRDKLIWALGFIPADAYLQDEYGDRWQQVRQALQESVEGMSHAHR